MSGSSVPTEAAPGWTREAFTFTLRAVAWSLGLFGLLRWGWLETHGLLALTRLQGRLAAGLWGTPALPVEVTLECSGADAMALCLGAILAYPAHWRMRFAGAGGGLGLILGLNTLRIGTLGRVAASQAWFEALHVYLWPAVLTLAVAGYVFTWMRVADRRRALGAARALPAWPAAPPSCRRPARLTRRFVLLTVAFLLLFTAASPLYLESAGVLAVAAFIARAAAAALGLLGVDARATANVLWTSRGSFLVTQECVSTPLIPVYVAGPRLSDHVALARAGPPRHGTGLRRPRHRPAPGGGPPGFARGLAALPGPRLLPASPRRRGRVPRRLLAPRRRRDGPAPGPPGRGRGPGVRLPARHPLHAPRGASGRNAGWRRAFGFAAGTPLEDPQGALALLPAFQVGLYLALWVAAFVAPSLEAFLAGLALLGLTQMATFVALHLLASHAGFTTTCSTSARGGGRATPRRRGPRAAGPRPDPGGGAGGRRRPWMRLPSTPPAGGAPPGSAYRRFWAEVGDRFPDLVGRLRPATTGQRAPALRRDFPLLEGLRLFKTDLWDEAKNTRILAWGEPGGARAYGVDISEPTVIQARGAFDREAAPRSRSPTSATCPSGPRASTPSIPWAPSNTSVDPERALEEMARVLRPGGRAIVGVPNRHDPFLRPLLAAALQALGLYAYGYEKSFRVAP